MKIFGKETLKTTFINVTIGDKCYDYPKDMPLPRIGETVCIGDSVFGKVTRIVYQVLGKHFRMININTDAE